MFDETRKSIKSALYERVSSPFYGTLIISWLVWNWKIVYLTFFVSESRIEGTKINYIIDNYSNVWNLIGYPTISTIVLLTLIPLVSNGAYWLSLRFKKWRTDKRNTVEDKQLLSIEKSIAIREEIRSQGENFEKLLDKKNEEIRILKSQVESQRKPTVSTSKKESKSNPTGIVKKTVKKELNPDQTSQFQQFINSGRIDEFIGLGGDLLEEGAMHKDNLENVGEAKAFGLIKESEEDYQIVYLTDMGNEFFKWVFLNNKDEN